MTELVIVELTDDNRNDVALAALAMYLGEPCKYCGKTADTLEDLKTVVYAPHAKGRIACQKCWDDNNPKEEK